MPGQVNGEIDELWDDDDNGTDNENDEDDNDNDDQEDCVEILLIAGAEICRFLSSSKQVKQQ